MMNNIKHLLFFALGFIVLSSCKKDDDDFASPDNPNEVELITTVKLIFTDQSNSSNIFQAIFKDTDGDGGSAPGVFDTIRLENGKTYDVEILLLDESKTPADTISKEVEEEAEEHQFFFTALNGVNVSFSYSDADANGVPIGLKSEWIANAVTAGKNGKVKVVLKHQGEDKPTTPPGDAGMGDTDVEIDFPILIE